ncbi:amino acid permease 6 [Actinidia rufa]|uniref:Amino acid permease 6 n=1 Tax=Actinidia rufa TaxID=165716 RepID=A0A7J0H167_9ERIC|nr:amino acid permease 6 [Actinidia rufa]
MTASAHIITAVIGSGVLSLAWAMAQLGWIAGPIALVIFSLITWFTAVLLADCYRHPITGRRNHTYMDVVRANLGGIKIQLCGLAQYTNLFGTSIGYTITTAISMAAIKRSNCFHKYGHTAGCHTSNNLFMVIFAVTEIILSQIPNFNVLSMLSIIAAVMSFTYSTIGLGLAIAKLAGRAHVKTSLTGIPVGEGVSSSQKIWNCFQALGNIAFAYAYSLVLVEIQASYSIFIRKSMLCQHKLFVKWRMSEHLSWRKFPWCSKIVYWPFSKHLGTRTSGPTFCESKPDTLKSSPPENAVMKKATLIGISVSTVFYMLCGVVGYAAFGNGAPGNFLTGFGFYEPFWLVDFANVCIVVHLVGAYQVYSQPIFGFVECWCRKRWPGSEFIAREYPIPIPFIGTFSLNFFRLVLRTAYVILTTLIATIFPFFNDFLGLLGAACFWPLTVYFPVEMYISQARIRKFSVTWTWMQLLSLLCFIVSLLAAAGSIQGLIKSVQAFKPFQSKL